MFFFRKKSKEASTSAAPPAKIVFDDRNLDPLLHYVEHYSGVNLAPKKEVLKQRLVLFCENNDIVSFDALFARIKADEAMRQSFINLITVNETYFYRETIQLEAAVAWLKERGGKARVLSAPCASGEEVYSLSMLASEAGFAPFSVNILGIDINSEAIQKAQKGVFSERSLHRLDEHLKGTYFMKIAGEYAIVRSRFLGVDFQVLNIFDDAFLRLEPFDIIFSRNMMIYFDDVFKQKTIERFHKLLKNGGRLYTGHADLVPNTPLFTKVTQGRLSYYEKV
ncbi:MAG: protein-glutamate O-methyltransferase CheR [Campylobacterales bacterium]|nr:protein-glutamate O-methyltransferase CheR [Campylobacterales bacterium]